MQQQARSELQKVVSALEARIANGELTGAELILGCRKILDLWIDIGGSSLDDLVISFTGIESQTGHVLSGKQVRSGRDVDRVRFEPGSEAERLEVEDIGRCFDDGFKRNLNDLARHLSGS